MSSWFSYRELVPSVRQGKPFYYSRASPSLQQGKLRPVNYAVHLHQVGGRAALSSMSEPVGRGSADRLYGSSDSASRSACHAVRGMDGHGQLVRVEESFDAFLEAVSQAVDQDA